MGIKKNDKWIYGGLLKKQWGFDVRTIAAIIYDNKIPAYDINYEQLDPEEARHTFIEEQKFRIEDIENFEIENEDLFKANMVLREHIMSAKEKRDLGQLRCQKEKWDSSINAAVKTGIYCQKEGKEMTRDEIQKLVFEIDNALPYTTFERIWKAIPEQFRCKGGRPAKKK